MIVGLLVATALAVLVAVGLDGAPADPLSQAALASAEPAPQVDVEPDLSGAQPQTALAAVALLEVKGRAPKTGYDRDLFAYRAVDLDRNGCDTRFLAAFQGVRSVATTSAKATDAARASQALESPRLRSTALAAGSELGLAEAAASCSPRLRHPVLKAPSTATSGCHSQSFLRWER